MCPPAPAGTLAAMNPRSLRTVAIRHRNRTRTGALACAVGVALLTAACGGSPPTGGSPSTGGGPQATAGGASSAMVTAELAYARCMRANGVANYPDPDPDGQLPASTNKQQLTSNPHLATAARTCSHLIPQSVIDAQNQADQREYVSFAQCMRTNGIPNFPDPTTRSGGTPIFNLAPAGIDTSSPQVRSAASRCQSMLHLAQLPRYEG
jgi:hypothetical protein